MERNDLDTIALRFEQFLKDNLQFGHQYARHFRAIQAKSDDKDHWYKVGFIAGILHSAIEVAKANEATLPDDTQLFWESPVDEKVELMEDFIVAWTDKEL